jgi:hypothetical protein
MMLQGVRYLAGYEPQGILFESNQTKVGVSLSKPHHTPLNVDEEYNKVTSHLVFFTN